MKNLGSAIKQLRGVKQWTQDELHARLSVSLSTVARYEANGAVDMSSAAKMAHWANEAGRPEIAEAFKDAVAKELGEDVVRLLCGAQIAHNPPPPAKRARGKKPEAPLTRHAGQPV